MTWNQDYSALSPVLRVIFCIESKFAVNQCQFRPPEGQQTGKQNSKEFDFCFANSNLYFLMCSRSNFNTRESNSRELVQIVQLYSKRLPPFLTIFGHKIALISLQLFTTQQHLISIKEGQLSRFEMFKTFHTFHEH